MVAVHEELREQLAGGAVTLIIGAGVSIQASGGAPRASWQGLLLNGADEVRSDPDFRERYPVVEQELRSNHPDDFISAARKISRALGAPNGGRYRSWLRRAIGQLPLADRSILDAIHGLGVRIATTNYDGLLSRARDGIPPVCWTEPSRVERVLRGDEAGIIHLHGYWERPESVILDASSYDQILGDEHAQAVMRTLRLTTTLVFIGCGAGLQDPNFEQFRAWLARVMHSSEYTSYRLALDGEVDGLQRMHGAARDGVRVVGYGARHEDLAPYLRSLVTAPATSTSPPAAFASTRDAAGTDRMVAPVQAGASAGNPSARARPIPIYADAGVEALSKRLEDARARRDKLCSAGFAADDIDGEILVLRRQLREGGRLRAGDTLGDGRYLLVRVVGRGGFAVVWEAYDCSEQQRVAIKVLHTNLAGDPLRRERFFRGAHAMMKLVHPAVVRVIEPEGEDGGFYYYIMEFVPGGNLRETVLARRVNNEDVLPLILRIGEALALAHSRGMIHRDIKPANILLDEHGNAKLTDFDLVGAHDTTGGTRTGALGTVVYAAPECLDKPQEATARVDVYGLGMTTIFCLAGHDLSLSTFRNPELTISKLNCSAHVRDILRIAVAWEPHDRFADAHAMTAELRLALEQPPIELSPPHPGNGVRLGVVDGPRAEPILLPLDDIKTHMAFLGDTGSGKTTAALSVVEQLLERDVSVVLVERKGDLSRYASEAWWTDAAAPEPGRARKLALRKRVDVALFTPGNSHGRPLWLPLVPSFADVKSQERERLARYAAEGLGAMMGYGKPAAHRAKTSILQCAIMLHGDERDITLDLLRETIGRPDPELLNAVGSLQRHFASLLEDVQTLRIQRGSLLSGDGEPLDLAALLPPPGTGRAKLSIINTSALTEVPLLQFWISRFLIELSVLGRRRPSAALQAAAFFDEADLYVPATSSPLAKDPMFDLLRRSRSTGIGVLLATQNPADFDYKACDNIHTWLLGKITQDRAIEKMRNLIGKHPDIKPWLASQRTGNFFLLNGTSEHALKVGRSLMEAVQLSESEIADLARRTRSAGASTP
jgi:DNA helicase HerA-like ATPase